MYNLKLLQLVDRRQPSTYPRLLSIAIASGGTATYVVGDILTLVGGVFTRPAKIIVTGVSVGVITFVRVIDNGQYTIPPSSPVSITGGGGTLATFTCTFGIGAVPIFRLDQAVGGDTFGASGQNRLGGILPVPFGTVAVNVTASISGFAGGDATSDVSIRIPPLFGNEVLPADGTTGTTRSMLAWGGDTAVAVNNQWDFVLNTAAPSNRTLSQLFWFGTLVGSAQTGPIWFSPGSQQVYFMVTSNGLTYSAGVLEIDSVSFFGYTF